MLIGYARVSTDDQNLDLQRDALQKAGCEQIFTDTLSGTKAERKGLSDALSHLRRGDTLVVWRLDRLGRSLRHLIDTVTDLQERGREEKQAAGQRHSQKNRYKCSGTWLLILTTRLKIFAKHSVSHGRRFI